MGCDNDDCIVFEQPVVSHQNFLLLDEMRREGKFCDVTLKVKGLSLRAHKVVLSAAVPYFHAMFTSNMLESKMSEITLQEIEAECLEALINFVYTGKIVIDITTVQSLILGASYFQLTEVLNACENFLCNRLKVHKVIGTRKLGTLWNCKALVNACQEFMEMHFHEVSSSLMRWIKKDPERRETYLPHLLPIVRLPLVSLEYLVNSVAKEELIKSSHEYRNLIDEVKDYLLLPESSKIKSFNSERRYQLGGIVIVFGGLNDYLEAVKIVESFDPLNGDWFLTTPMITACTRRAVAVVNRSLYAMGGDFGLRGLSQVERFDFDTKQWFPIPPMHSIRSAGGAAALGNKVYVCGGFGSSKSLKSVEYYDIESGTWTLAESMITRRSSCAVVALNGYLYALGGHNDKTVLDLVERYDQKARKWTKVTPMLTKRCRLGAAALNGKLYACGGFDGLSFLKTVEMYDPKDNIWRMVAPMNTKRSRVALAVTEGNLWAIGGYDGENCLSTVEIYNPFFDK